MRTRVKICGITRTEDAMACTDSGVDAIGLVFHPASPRNIDIERAREIVASLSPFVSIVGLFMDADAEKVEDVIANVHLDMLQFHGQESPDFCEQFNAPYLKAIAMGEGDADIKQMEERYPTAAGFLLDSHQKDTAGGSGKTFDWAKFPEKSAKKLILAGGLNPDNVQSAIRTVHPYAVDCSSGVEARPGIKDHELIRIFMEKVADV